MYTIYALIYVYTCECTKYVLIYYSCVLNMYYIYEYGQVAEQSKAPAVHQAVSLLSSQEAVSIRRVPEGRKANC